MARRRTSNLGPALEPLLGREGECEAAEKRIREGARLVTLTGPGGIGKSSVAREVGRRLAGDGGRAGDAQGSVLLCELADTSSLEGLLLAVARAASIAGPGSSRVDRAPSRGKPVAETLAKRLAASSLQMPLTLLLDDADAVVPHAATFVRACLDASAELRFLVTSREALGVEGERVQVVGPLGAEAALALFESRAGGGSWSASQVATLAQHLDGLPLGIELAARRSRLVPPGDLLDRLEERFRLLKSDRRDVAARHATLSATIEWSLARLGADESRAFAAVGAFEGSFSVEAFEAVVGPLLEGDALDAAESLLRKSLVASVESTGAARLTMLRTLRAFARERLDAVLARDREATELRHATFYVERAEAAGPRLYGADAEQALDDLEADLPNLLRAMEREKARRPDLAARALAALGDVVVLRNAVDLRSPIFREATAAADAHGDVALRMRTRVVEAKVILELAGAAAAEALLVEALAIADAAGGDVADAADVADVRRSLAWARIALGQADSALVLLEEALAVHRAQRNVRGEADALTARGLTQCLRGQIREGHTDLENACALHVMAHDAIRREKVLEIAAVVGLDLDLDPSLVPSGDDDAQDAQSARITRLRAAAEAHRASGRPWREAMARFQLAELEQPPARAESASGSAPPAGASAEASPPEAAPPEASVSAGSTASAPRWRVGPDARWLCPPGAEPIDLARHGSLRRVLDALVARRLAEPGVASSAIALLDSGWPDEKVRHESGMLRVYSVVRRLRGLGLGEALVTRDDGYLLDPNVRFERGEGAPA